MDVVSGAMVSVRFAGPELEQVRACAARLGVSVSAFIREAALRPAPYSSTTYMVFLTWPARADLAAVGATHAMREAS